MVLWSSGSNGGRGRILSSKRTLLSGSLLLLILFYYVALPDPQQVVGSLDDRTAFQVESASRKNKKGSSALMADDTEIMKPLPARENGSGNKALPWLNSFVERVKLDRRLPVMDYLRSGQEVNVDSSAAVSTADCSTENDASKSCLGVSTSSVGTATLDTTEMDMLADRDGSANPFYGTDKDVSLESQPVKLEVMEDDEGNVIDVTPVEDSTFTDEWSSEKEAASIQEEDDEQGFEKEDGIEQELLELEEQVEAVSEMEAEAKARVEEAEEVLEDAIDELREEREEEILEETEEAILERIEEAEEESGGVLTEEMVRMIEDEVVAEEEENLEESMHGYVESLFRGGGESEDEDEEDDVESFEGEDVADVAETESEIEYKKEDLLGQAGPGETMDDEE